MGVVFQPRMIDLAGRKVQKSFQNPEGFLLAAHFDGDKIAELKNQAAHLMQQQPLLFLDGASDQERFAYCC